VEPASLLSFRIDDRYWTGHQRCFKPVTLKSQVFCCTRAGLAVLPPATSRHFPLFTLTRAQPGWGESRLRNLGRLRRQTRRKNRARPNQTTGAPGFARPEPRSTADQRLGSMTCFTSTMGISSIAPGGIFLHRNSRLENRSNSAPLNRFSELDPEATALSDQTFQRLSKAGLPKASV